MTIHPNDRWEVTGLSSHGAYVKVRGTTPGKKWAIANIPFTIDGDRFHGVEEATDYAHLIAACPQMHAALTKIASGLSDVQSYQVAKDALDKIVVIKGDVK